MAVSPIHVSNICFATPLGETIFDHLSLSIQCRVSGIVGLNGAGKSLLAKMIAGIVAPTSGQIQTHGQVGYVPQAWHGSANDTLAHVLRLEKALSAMRRITQGDLNVDHFQAAESYWDWESRLQACVNNMQLQFVPDLARKIGEYSGGQQIQLLILAAIFHGADIIILDEPTNHLDSEARRSLLHWIRTSDRVFVLISHDPQLLSNVEEIWEITGIGVYHYGGAYALYRESRQQRHRVMAHDLADIKKRQRQQLLANQAEREKQQQRAAYGKLSSVKKGRSKIEIGTAKEHSSAGLSAQRKSSFARETLLAAQRKRLEEKLEHEVPIAFDLPGSRLEAGKRVLEMKACVWGYDHALHKALDYVIQGPQRVHLQGANGVGKSALLKTIAGELRVLAGSCKTKVVVACLDQQLRFFDETTSALQAFQWACPGLKQQDYYDRLAWIGFRGESTQINVSKLSGGNRMKLAIACVLLGASTPQLLLLDEPSNHLDLHAREALVQSLSCYQGALMVASHDMDFVRQLNCNVTLPLPC